MTKSILAKTATGEIQLTVTIPAQKVKAAYDKAFEEIAKELELPGFRKGKAPKKLLEEKIDKSKVYERVLQTLVPQAYIEAIKEHNSKPILTPKVELLKAKEGEDWEIRATTCEEPKVELGNYKEEIKKALAPTKIWTPATQKTQNKTESTEDEKSQKVIQKLLEIIKVDLPEMLVEDEVSRTLANLINQTNTLGLTIDQYLSSIGKTAQSLRAEYKEKVVDQLKLQFTLDEIAEKEKIEVSDKEVDDLIKATGDEKLKQNLNEPFQKEYLKGILRRRKSLDFLVKL